jgi:type VI protein secretion system component VasK
MRFVFLVRAAVARFAAAVVLAPHLARLAPGAGLPRPRLPHGHPAVIPVPWRLVGAAVLLGVLVWAGWTVNGWRADAGRMKAAEAALADARQDHAEALRRIRENLAEEQGARAALARDLEAIGERAAREREAIRPRELVRIVEVPANAPTCPAATLSDDFRLRWNAAGTP